MRVSAKVDYAIRACAELAAVAGEGPVKGERIAQAQEIPLRFLENILLDLRHAGLVSSQRGAEGGYWLAKPPDEIVLADLIRALEGPIANVRGHAAGGHEVRGAGEGAADRLGRGAREPARRARDGHAGRSRRRPAAARGRAARAPTPRPGSPG